MLAKRRLRTIGEVKSGAEEDLINPSEVWWDRDKYLNDIGEDEFNWGPKPAPLFFLDWKKPSRVRGIVGDKLPRFMEESSLARNAKEKLYRGFRILPEPQTYQTRPQELRSIVEIADYGKVGFGQVNATNDSPYAGRGIWGQLQSTLVKAVNVYLASEKAGVEAELKAVQAQLAPVPTTVTKIVGVLPYVLIGGGILYFLKKRKGGM